VPIFGAYIWCLYLVPLLFNWNRWCGCAPISEPIFGAYINLEPIFGAFDWSLCLGPIFGAYLEPSALASVVPFF
jgi:hypothetical protein